MTQVVEGINREVRKLSKSPSESHLRYHGRTALHHLPQRSRRHLRSGYTHNHPSRASTRPHKRTRGYPMDWCQRLRVRQVRSRHFQPQLGGVAECYRVRTLLHTKHGQSLDPKQHKASEFRSPVREGGYLLPGFPSTWKVLTRLLMQTVRYQMEMEDLIQLIAQALHCGDRQLLPSFAELRIYSASLLPSGVMRLNPRTK